MLGVARLVGGAFLVGPQCCLTPLSSALVQAKPCLTFFLTHLNRDDTFFIM